ncbi:hypothetical protein GCM10009593_00450 [Microlunatus antarcticus]
MRAYGSIWAGFDGVFRPVRADVVDWTGSVGVFRPVWSYTVRGRRRAQRLPRPTRIRCEAAFFSCADRSDTAPRVFAALLVRPSPTGMLLPEPRRICVVRLGLLP